MLYRLIRIFYITLLLILRTYEVQLPIKEIVINDCSVSRIFGEGLTEAELNKIRSLFITHKTPLHYKDYLYRMNEPCSSVFFVKQGSFRADIINEDGETQTLSIHLQGALLGIDGLFQDHYGVSMISLETSVVCEIYLQDLYQLCIDEPSFQKVLMQLIGKEINDNHQQLVLLGKHSAKLKIATFLYNLANKYKQIPSGSPLQLLFPSPSPSPSQNPNLDLHINLRREAIGHYLSMNPQTVSRQLTELCKLDIISVENNIIHINNFAELKAISCSVNHGMTANFKEQ